MKTPLVMLMSACVTGMFLPVCGATTITGSQTLSADADWTADGVVTVASGASLDLNGWTLKVAGLAGEGAITSTFANLSTDTSKASSNNEFLNDGVPGNAFDDSSRVIVKSDNWPMVIVYDFSAPTLINTYRIVNHSGNYEKVRAPGAWSLWGSSDNSSWTELDSRTNITEWTASEVKRFDFENFTKYRYYKIDIAKSTDPTANNGGYIQFKQLQYGRKGTVAVADADSIDTAGLSISSNVVAELSGDIILSKNCDLSGFGACSMAEGATTDLNGHDLTVSSLCGAGTITDTADVGNLTGAGTASCSDGITSVDPDATADRAFNSENRVIAKAQYLPFSVAYDFGEATIVDTYSIKAADDHPASRSPATWELCGSVDGENWVSLDRRREVTDWTDNPTKNFDFINTTAYRHYKITIDKQADPSATYGKHIAFQQLKYGRRSELCVSVQPGVETTNAGVTLAGNLRLVKAGDGTLTMQKTAQSYSGGTVVTEGTLVFGADGSSSPLGAAGQIVGATADGTIDLNGKLGCSAYRFALAGGTLKNAVEVGYQGSGMIGDIYLFADSSFVFDKGTFIGSTSGNSAILDLGGNTLNVSMQPTTHLRLYNAIVDNGTVSVGDRGTFVIGGNDGVIATNANFSICTGLNVDKSFKVNDYESTWALANGYSGSATMSVYGAFRPTTDYFYGCQLMDGSALDLSTRTTCLNAQSSTTGGLRTIAFEENATVEVKLGSRRILSGTQLVSWTSDTKPANIDTVRFVCTDDDRKCAFYVESDGLYYRGTGFMIIFF